MLKQIWKDITSMSLKKLAIVLSIYLLIIIISYKVIPVEKVIEHVGTYGVYGPILFIVLYIIRGFFNFPTAVFLIVSSLLFPLPWALIYYGIAIALSITTSYCVGRVLRAHAQWLPKFSNKINHEHLEQKLKIYGYFGLFLLDLTGITFDLPNYAGGYFKLPFWKLFLTTFLSNAVTTLLYYMLFIFVHWV